MERHGNNGDLMGTTTNYGWSYPEGTDLVTDGALNIETLATDVDTQLYASTRHIAGRWTGATGLVAGWTLVTWTAETEDTSGFLTPSATTLTIPAGLGGLYQVHVRVNTLLTTAVTPEVSIRWTTAAFGQLYDVQRYVNNASYLLGSYARCNINATQYLAPGDTIDIFAKCSSNAASATEELIISRIGL